MIVTSLLMLVGLALLVAGAEALVRGATALSSRLGVSPIVAGLTVVAFGTSTPELAVNLSAAFAGNTALSFGNVVGSNISNVGLILAVAALVRPLNVSPSVVNREIPMLLLGTAAANVMALDRALDGSAIDHFTRVDGIVLLLLFAVFLYYTIFTALRQRAEGDLYVEELREEVATRRPQRVAVSLLLAGLGLVGVVFGARWTVENAVQLARHAGMSDTLIGLTVIAVGTGLPELVTSILAAWRGHSDLAVGNVVGSNIYNLLLVMGATAIVKPVDIPVGGHADLLVMVAVTASLLPLILYRRRRIGRPGGALLLTAYVLYVAWRAFGGAG
jgi:cation:H+ antiporter